jgi:hypothetical protein
MIKTPCPSEYRFVVNLLLKQVEMSRKFIYDSINKYSMSPETMIDKVANNLRNIIFDNFTGLLFEIGYSVSLRNPLIGIAEHLYSRKLYTGRQLLTLPSNIFKLIDVDYLWTLLRYRYGCVIRVSKEEHDWIESGWKKDLPYEFNDKFQIDYDYMKLYIEKCKENNIKIIFTPPYEEFNK